MTLPEEIVLNLHHNMNEYLLKILSEVFKHLMGKTSWLRLSLSLKVSTSRAPEGKLCSYNIYVPKIKNRFSYLGFYFQCFLTEQ